MMTGYWTNGSPISQKNISGLQGLGDGTFTRAREKRPPVEPPKRSPKPSPIIDPPVDPDPGNKPQDDPDPVGDPPDEVKEPIRVWGKNGGGIVIQMTQANYAG